MRDRYHTVRSGSCARPLARIAAVVALIAIAACSDGVAPTPGVPARVQATTGTATVGRGDTLRLEAIVLDARGRVLRDSTARWRSLDPLKASVAAATGLATGIDTGTARIVASSGAAEDTVVLTVTRRVASIALTFAADSAFIGVGAPARAVARDAAGAVIENAPLLWATSDGSRVVVSDTGIVSGIEEGMAELRVASGAVVVSRTVRAVYRRLAFGGVRPASVSMGGSHACALDADGRAYCWGNGSSGEVGRGPLTNAFGPILGDYRFTRVETRDRTSCGLTTGRRLLCWGSLTTAPRRSSTPQGIIDSIPSVDFAVGMHAQACVLGEDGVLRCWGHNDTYQLGRGPRVDDYTAPRPVAGEQRFAGAVALGGFDGCAMGTDGAPWCWGDINGAIVGDNSRNDRPVRMNGAPAFAEIESFSWGAACGRTAAGEVWCWGFTGQSDVRVSTPVRIEGMPALRRIDSGYGHACGIAADGAVWCWTASFASSPTQAAPRVTRFAPQRRFREFFTSSSGTCGIQDDDAVLCAGPVVVTGL